MATRAKHKRSPAPAPRSASPPAPPTPLPLWHPRWDGWLIVLLALAIRVIYLLNIRAADPFYDYTLSGFDQHTYQRMAHDILGGDLLLRSWGLFYYGPLYGYFSALVYWIGGADNFDLLHAIQAAIGAAACWTLWALARTYLTRGEALLAGLMATLAQAWLFYEQLLLMEGLVLFLNVLVLYLVRKSEVAAPLAPARFSGARLFIAGAASALSFIGRGNFAVFIAALPIWIFFRVRDTSIPIKQSWRRPLAFALLYLAGVALVLAPIGWRNLAVGHRLIFGTTNGPAMLYLGNAADASGEFQYSPRFDAAHQQAQADPNIYSRQLREDLREHPGAVLFNLLRKTYFFWNAYDLPDNTSYYLGLGFSPLLRWNPVFPQLLLVLGLLGAALSWRSWRRESLLWLYLILFSASIILIVPVGRYKLPITIPLLIFAARALGWARGALFERRVPSLLFASAGAAALAFVTFPYKSPRVRSNDYWNFTIAALDRGKLHSARSTIASDLRDYPKAAEPYVLQFQYLVEAEQWPQAKAAFEKLLSLGVRLPMRASFAAARLYAHEGDRAQAGSILHTILQVKPDYPGAQALLDSIDASTH